MTFVEAADYTCDPGNFETSIRRPAWRPWRRLMVQSDGTLRYAWYGTFPALTLDDYKATDWEVI